MYTEPTSESIIIKLNESGDAKSFKTENLIHKLEFERVMSIIKARIDRIKDNKNDAAPERLHDTITILGSRGSGKTSFLQSIQQVCINKDNLSEYESYKNTIEVLDIIDPTLIEEKGHVFLNIISLIQEAVNKTLNKNECNPTENTKNRRKEWNDKISELAAGIPSMDGVGGHLTDNNWQDPEYIMNKGLIGVSSARKLEIHFNKIIKEGLDILGKKIFLLVFDDIDIDFKKGWPVLETIRKYCTSPRLVILLSGDMHLYSLAIRKQQWKNFGRPLLVNESEQQNKLTYFNDMVTEMEGQYMQKVMKSINRIHLKTLNEKLLIGKPEIHINKENKEKGNRKRTDTEIEEVYNKVLKEFGINNNYQAEAYRSFLLSMPLRSQIQFLSTFYKDTNEWIGISKSQQNQDVIINAFLSELYDKQVDVQLATSIPKFLNIVILQLLLKEKVLAGAYQLQPTTMDKSLNSSLTALNFLLSLRIKSDPYLIFDYIIRIGLTSNLLSSLGYLTGDDSMETKDKSRNKKSEISTLKASIEGLCKHSSIFQDKILRDTMGLINAYMQSYSNKNKWGGAIRLEALEESRKRGFKDRLDVILEKLEEDKRALGYFPLSMCKYSYKNSSEAVYSVFSLFACVCELIKFEKENSLSKGILELSQKRYYTMPNFENSSSNTNEEGEVIGEIDSEDNQDGKTFTESKLKKAIENWISRFKELPQRTVSIHLLGKITTRAFVAFDNSIYSEKKESFLGKLMQNRMVTFFNSILIEDIKENIADFKGLNINNTQTDYKIFDSNLKKANEHDKDLDNLYLSKWILACPLLLPFLENKEGQPNQLVNRIINFCYKDNEKQDIEALIRALCLFPELQQVSVLADVKTQKGKSNKDKKVDSPSLDNKLEDIISHFKQEKKEKLFYAYKKNKIEIEEIIRQLMGSDYVIPDLVKFKNIIYPKRTKKQNA